MVRHKRTVFVILLLCLSLVCGHAASADDGPRPPEPVCPEGVPRELCDVPALPEETARESTRVGDADAVGDQKGPSLPDTGGIKP